MIFISINEKPEAVPARVTLCVTSLLTLSTQHAQSQKSLPPVSYIKAIDIFMSSCTVFVFASLMEYALVNILMADEVHVSVRSMSVSNSTVTNPKNHSSTTTGAAQPNATTVPLYTSSKVFIFITYSLQFSMNWFLGQILKSKQIFCWSLEFNWKEKQKFLKLKD